MYINQVFGYILHGVYACAHTCLYMRVQIKLDAKHAISVAYTFIYVPTPLPSLISYSHLSHVQERDAALNALDAAEMKLAEEREEEEERVRMMMEEIARIKASMGEADEGNADADADAYIIGDGHGMGVKGMQAHVLYTDGTDISEGRDSDAYGMFDDASEAYVHAYNRGDQDDGMSDYDRDAYIHNALYGKDEDDNNVDDNYNYDNIYNDDAEGLLGDGGGAVCSIGKAGERNEVNDLIRESHTHTRTHARAHPSTHEDFAFKTHADNGAYIACSDDDGKYNGMQKQARTSADTLASPHIYGNGVKSRGIERHLPIQQQQQQQQGQENQSPHQHCQPPHPQYEQCQHATRASLCPSPLAYTYTTFQPLDPSPPSAPWARRSRPEGRRTSISLIR